MAPKDPTRYQLSSRLAYSQDTPRFLQRLKNSVAGQSNDEDAADAEFDEWEATSGRPPIPRRPTPPQRPEDDPGSAEEDSGDEKPQIVVLKEGKHMSELEVENEKRKARGLPPLREPSTSADTKDASVKNEKASLEEKSTKQKTSSLSFSSGKTASNKGTSRKRKAVGDELDNIVSAKAETTKKKSKTKKVKSGALLSFAEGDEA